MQLNDKQRSYLIIIAGFVLGSIIFEVGYFFMKGRINLEHTPFIVAGALVGGVIGIISNRNK